jgi:hypothetical protein
MLTNIHQNSFQTSVIFRSEQPSFYVPNILYFFVPNIQKNDFMFYIRVRTSGYLTGCPEEQGRKRTNPANTIQTASGLSLKIEHNRSARDKNVSYRSYGARMI